MLTTIHGIQEVDTKAVDELMASHFKENEVIVPLPRTYVRQRIPADRDKIPRLEELQGWSYLQIIRKHSSHGRRGNRTPARTKLP